MLINKMWGNTAENGSALTVVICPWINAQPINSDLYQALPDVKLVPFSLFLNFKSWKHQESQNTYSLHFNQAFLSTPWLGSTLTERVGFTCQVNLTTTRSSSSQSVIQVYMQDLEWYYFSQSLSFLSLNWVSHFSASSFCYSHPMSAF